MPPKRRTALAEAFEEAGIKPAAERLAEIADAAIAANPAKLDDARALVLRDVAGDAALLWEMFQPWHRKAADEMIQAAVQRKLAAKKRISEAGATLQTARQPTGSGANGHADIISVQPQRPGAQRAGPTHFERTEARTETAKIYWKLDTFKINGRPIGDCTAQEALGWRASRVRDNRFVYLLTAGLPPDVPIRNFITPQESEKFYLQAQRDSSNE